MFTGIPEPRDCTHSSLTPPFFFKQSDFRCLSFKKKSPAAHQCTARPTHVRLWGQITVQPHVLHPCHTAKKRGILQPIPENVSTLIFRCIHLTLQKARCDHRLGTENLWTLGQWPMLEVSNLWTYFDLCWEQETHSLWGLPLWKKRPL